MRIFFVSKACIYFCLLPVEIQIQLLQVILANVVKYDYAGEAPVLLGGVVPPARPVALAPARPVGEGARPVDKDAPSAAPSECTNSAVSRTSWI